MEIKCKNCGKVLFSTNETNNSLITLEAIHKGFIFKIPLLYSLDYERCIFCDKKCCHEWFENNVTDEDRKKGNEIIAKMRKDLPNAIKGATGAVIDFKKKLLYIKAEIKKGRKYLDIINDKGLEDWRKAYDNVHR